MFVRKTIAVAGLTTALVGAATPAFAWDCIRASGSVQGLQASGKSGNWETMTIDDLVAGGVAAGFLPAEAAGCVVDGWLAMGEPSTFAIGTGVAGARGAQQSGHLTDADFFELAKNAPFHVVIDGQGVDHLDDAIEIVVAGCVDDGAAG